MSQTKTTRAPAVAGMFYPADSNVLQTQVNEFIHEKPYASTTVPKAIIVPHAGTIYSGSIAAAAYRTLLPYRHVIRKVILLGPAHRVYLNGLALPTVDQFQTPLGEINLDTKTIKSLVTEFSQISFSDRAHAEEHSLEVQLPFLQEILASFRLIPFVVGETSQQQVAEVIDQLWGGEECLIIISTDLSHFHNYSEALKLDHLTATLIESFQGEHLEDGSACGRFPLRGLLQIAQQRNMSIQRLDLRNSGDTAGGKDQVVGYGSWGLYA